MTTISQVARAMREILTTTADEAARATRFVQRTSLSGATFSQTVVLGFLGTPQASLEEWTQTAAAPGVNVSPPALDQRLTASAAACLAQVLRAAVARGRTAKPVAIPLLARFPAVYVQDSSTIVLPALLAAKWQGCGGTATGTSAALKLQARLERRSGRLDVQRQDGRASDRSAVLPCSLPGSLRLADLGYWSLTALEALKQQEVWWLSRLQMQTAVYDATGTRRDLLELLEGQGTDTVELAVRLGEHQCLPAHLFATRIPQDVAATRWRRLRQDARKQGRQVSAARLALAAWTILVTTVPTERLALQEALVLGRMRWQMGLLCKLWKSQGRVDESRSTKAWRILCEVSAKLLAMLGQHWSFLVSCWAYPDRSLVKAAQTVQKHALHRASAFHNSKWLARAITIVKRCLVAGCRMHRWQKQPNTYQLLLNTT